MKIRLHLVRFMYINLILSCCFWLYDIDAAADVVATNAATVNNAEEKIQEAGPRRQGPVTNEEDFFINPLLNVKNDVNVPTEKGPAATTAQTTVAAPKISSSSTSSRPDADNMMKVGTEPITDTETINAAVTDTSVNMNVLPSDVNFNNNSYVSVVPNSVENSNAENEVTVNVPNNQLNKQNDNMYITNNVDVNQLDKSQPTNLVDNVVRPISAKGQKQQKQDQQEESLPEIITDLPTVTVAELEHVKERLTLGMPQDAPSSSNTTENQPQTEAQIAQKAELNINDPGGGLKINSSTGSESNAALDANVIDDESVADAAVIKSRNATVEEVPMPVFSEWAQKQIEAEASREQAMELEQQVVNTSAQRKDATGSGSGKPTSLKLRAKNYASPDCGAKIIASNADATNTGAVLSHSSDEYMLSTCGSRIWFVVELCEAVQAQKVELANFELFSSSPKNFTVAVSKRFPTRDWSNVGRFAAEDKRTVQTFDLHPHLFGKFVRVDIHSHYSKEHFCPISLFRVFGTSEFEAFETEIRHSEELDDFDDDFGGQELQHKPFTGTDIGGANIFQSASDAVIQMVKKAAQVLVKPTKAIRWSSDSSLCYTPTVGLFSCKSCNSSIVDRINNLLSCQFQQLQQLVVLPQLRNHLLQTRICQSDYNISLDIPREADSLTSGMDKRQSFYLTVLSAEHVGAICKLLEANLHSTKEKIVDLTEPAQQVDVTNTFYENVSRSEPSKELEGDAKITVPNESLPDSTHILKAVPVPETPSCNEVPANSLQQDGQVADGRVIPDPPSDVNIFNVPPANQKDPTPAPAPLMPDSLPPSPSSSAVDTNELQPSRAPFITTTNHPPTTSGESDNGDLIGSGNGLDDSNLSNWESIDSLLTTTVASITAGGGAAAAAAAVVNGNTNMGNSASAGAAGTQNLQPKLAHGPQSESVFIRLSNRIKALERNMSLSGQYLEELSRRYKKQVEELQQTLTQQALTVRTLEEQSRRFLEQEQLYQHQNTELAGEVRALTYQVQACILVIIIVGTCIFLMLVGGTVFYRKLRRQTQQLMPRRAAMELTKTNLCRRKSYEEIMQQSPGKQRRPSEEAMLILNGCGDRSVEEQSEVGHSGRQRKISVCYGSNNNITNHMINTRTSLHRRKGAKNSWHSCLDSAPVSCLENVDKFFDLDTLKAQKMLTKPTKKKSLQLFPHELKRQESAPANCTQEYRVEEHTQSDFDESLILDDDDLCNFIPTTDLAYNEFMPDGPSGYQIVDTVDGKSSKGQATKKSRRVSSPAFFKSPFSKSKNKEIILNGDGSGSRVKASQSAHEATSWEWYRLKRSDKQHNSKHLTTVSVASNSPNASIDNSSLSEVSFPFNSTQNSFRILGEAIQSSGEGRASGMSSTVAAGSSSSSGASTTSSTTKKKQRAFNNIFRKVF